MRAFCATLVLVGCPLPAAAQTAQEIMIERLADHRLEMVEYEADGTPFGRKAVMYLHGDGTVLAIDTYGETNALWYVDEQGQFCVLDAEPDGTGTVGAVEGSERCVTVELDGDTIQMIPPASAGLTSDLVGTIHPM